jgi:acyl-CoA thioester hydrolase
VTQPAAPDLPPLPRHRETVRPAWIDYNGHMNVAYYVLVFDHATDALLETAGLGPSYAARGEGSVFAVETHVTYDREVGEDAPLDVSTQVLGADDKRLHLFHTMHDARDGTVSATNEVLLLHVDMRARRVARFPEPVRAALAAVAADHARHPWPAQAGRAIRPLAGAVGAEGGP